ncbi:hypothetical protein [Brevundimonas sp.]|uniref:hypothetical protein n=1 Tax=Brevundimonas sp. TaxID=1871086 RepID=UPI0025BD859F|nr:hypothetical protein [Brevundimonas sp.]MCG2663374.1 hypothetical protein [Brevundimonas sp.]
MADRPSPIRLGIPEGKRGWPVRVTALGVHVLAEGASPKVKIHYGRLGRFAPRADLPRFDGVEAWFRMYIDRGLFHVGDQGAAPEKTGPSSGA